MVSVEGYRRGFMLELSISSITEIQHTKRITYSEHLLRVKRGWRYLHSGQDPNEGGVGFFLNVKIDY